VDVLVWGVEQVRRIVAQPPLAEMTRGEVTPGRAVDSPRDLATWVRGNVYPSSHWVGTCAMGGDGTTRGGAPSVVDASLKVRPYLPPYLLPIYSLPTALSNPYLLPI
jgi:choline dehydrogenase